jgi:hypothetical protein
MDMYARVCVFVCLFALQSLSFFGTDFLVAIPVLSTLFVCTGRCRTVSF